MENTVFNEVYDLCMRAKAHSSTLARARTEVKNQALCTFAKLLRENADAILSANAKDIERAEGISERGGGYRPSGRARRKGRLLDTSQRIDHPPCAGAYGRGGRDF